MSEKELIPALSWGLVGVALSALLLGGIAWSLAATVAYLPFAWWSYQRLQRILRAKLLAEYARRVDNIYERSHRPGDRHVYTRAQVHRNLLRESGNLLHVHVHELYWEPWETEEEFAQRCQQFEVHDMKKRRTWLRQKGETFYKYAAHRQEGVPYEPTRYGGGLDYITQDN